MGSTKALLHFNGVNGGTVITDSTGLQSWTTLGSAQLSTANVWGGNSSLWQSAWPGNNAAQSTINANFLPGTNDFTVDIRFKSNAGFYLFYNELSNPGIAFAVTAGLKVQGALITPSGQITAGGNTTISAAVWNHAALVRSGTSLTVYINGTAETTVGNVSTLSAIGSAGTAMVGYGAVGGYVDEFRYSNIARYTANFTPPTGEYQLLIPTPIVFN